jgi:general secretion pathway protein G
MKRQKGFTLIELLVVIAILGILVVAGLVSLNSARVKARDSQRKTDLRAVSQAMDLYYTDKGAYPVAAGFGDIVTELMTSTPPYLNKVVKDPATTQSYKGKSSALDYCLGATLENAGDASIADDGGADVATYEVYSSNPATACTALAS